MSSFRGRRQPPRGPRGNGRRGSARSSAGNLTTGNELQVRGTSSDSVTQLPLGMEYTLPDGTLRQLVDRSSWYEMQKASGSRPNRSDMAREFTEFVLPEIVKRNPAVRTAIGRSVLLDCNAMQETQSMDYEVESAPAGSDTKPWMFFFHADCLVVASMVLRKDPTERVCVLNFASWRQPGGKLLEGSILQEESLCIRTTLLAHISQPSIKYPLKRHELIYSPDVHVFSLVPTLALDPEQRFKVDVITCAAVDQPRLTTQVVDGTQRDTYAQHQDYNLMVRKIYSILQTATSNGCTTLVLGAFGCGGGKNPRDEVAAIFRKVLLETNWRAKNLRHIAFAINDRWDGRPLWDAFVKVFAGTTGVTIDYDGLVLLTLNHA